MRILQKIVVKINKNENLQQKNCHQTHQQKHGWVHIRGRRLPRLEGIQGRNSGR